MCILRRVSGYLRLRLRTERDPIIILDYYLHLNIFCYVIRLPLTPFTGFALSARWGATNLMYSTSKSPIPASTTHKYSERFS